jgi:pimeloyl-ACP methyl ester carboxylesterase
VPITAPVVPAARTWRPRSGRDLAGVPVVGAPLLVAGVVRLRRSPRALLRIHRRIAGDPGALDRLPALAELAGRVTARLATTPLRHSARSFVAALRCDLRPVAPGVGARTLWVAGDADPLCLPADCDALAATMPDARVLPVPGAGHFVHFERPERVLPAVAGFLA